MNGTVRLATPQLLRHPARKAHTRHTFTLAEVFAFYGYGEYSLGGYSLLAGLVTEFVLTLMVLEILLGVTAAGLVYRSVLEATDAK